MVTTKCHVDGWSLTKREGVAVNIVFFCSSANLFFSGTKRSKSLTLNVGVFGHRSHLQAGFGYRSEFSELFISSRIKKGEDQGKKVQGLWTC